MTITTFNPYHNSIIHAVTDMIYLETIVMGLMLDIYDLCPTMMGYNENHSHIAADIDRVVL